MKKIKLILNESLISNKDSDIIEDTTVVQKPDYQIIDITVIPDESYYPTIQSILIDLDENNKLKESDSNKLDINILSETVNQKTGYSNSLFEFESSNHTVTLSLVLQETDRRGIYTVEAYTTRGIKVFESNTYRPRYVIESYLNSLANEYLIDKPLKEGYSLGDDRESFDVWDKNNKMLDEIMDFIKKNADPEVTAHIDDVEHSQDNISTACITLNGIADDVINSDRDYELYNKLERDYPFLNNVQAEHWGGKNICMVDFYIDGVYNKNKYGLCKVLKRVLDEFGDKNLNEAEERNPFSDDGKIEVIKTIDFNNGTGFIGFDKENEAYHNSYWANNSDSWNTSSGPFKTAEEAEKDLRNDVSNNDNPVDQPAPTEEQNTDDYTPEEFKRAEDLTQDILNLNINYSEWNNSSPEEREELVKPELARFLLKNKAEFDKDAKLLDLVKYNLTDKNFHTEAKVLEELYRGGK